MATVSSALSRPRRYPKPLWAAMLLYRHMQACRQYRRAGTTTPEARINLRRLFRLTNGRFNDIAARLDGLLHPPMPLSTSRGLLRDLSRQPLARIASDLRADGVHRFEGRLPQDLCERLHRFALRAPCRLYPGDGTEPVNFDPEDVKGTWYEVDDQALHENADIQTLAGDLSLLAAAQAYLRCRPVFTGCTMWWSAAFRDEPDGDLAQLFHFDMNHVKFLKVFIYLTDVGEDTGPHVFVRGSHRRLPRALLDDRRYTDEEVLEHYPTDRILSITGPAGTVFAEDTRGLHKGMALREGHRLLLQLQYATSPLGGAVSPVILNDRFQPAFLETVARYPRTYRPRFRRPAP